MESIFSQSGGTYTLTRDYRLPDLAVPNASDFHIGTWGRRRLCYLKKHRKILYINLLASGKLYDHLAEIDVAACEQQAVLIQQLSKARGITEHLKAENQLLWVGKMNNIYACANEIINRELIYT